MLLPFFNLDLLIVIRLCRSHSSKAVDCFIHTLVLSRYIQHLRQYTTSSGLAVLQPRLLFQRRFSLSFYCCPFYSPLYPGVAFLSWRSFTPTDVVGFIFSFIYFLSVILSHDFCCIHPIFFLFNPQFSSQADLLCKTFWRPGPGCSKGRQRYAPNQSLSNGQRGLFC